ncbi:unnamed protein product [Chrysoparadoxa australica]
MRTQGGGLHGCFSGVLIVPSALLVTYIVLSVLLVALGPASKGDFTIKIPSEAEGGITIKVPGEKEGIREALKELQAPPVSISTHIHFGVILAVFERSTDPYFLLPRITSLEGLSRQTFSQWSLILVGDGLTPEAKSRIFEAVEAAGVPAKKVHFGNLPDELREVNTFEPNEKFGKCTTAWCFAGVNAINMALDMAQELSHVTHVARLDDDDVWFPKHLEHLVSLYEQEPSTDIAFTLAAYKWTPGKTHKMYLPRRTVTSLEPIPAPPIACDLVHSVISWDLRGVLGSIRYRGGEEQLASKVPRLHGYCLPARQKVMAADADMWGRMNALVEESSVRSMLLPQVDSIYTVISVK